MKGELLDTLDRLQETQEAIDALAGQVRKAPSSLPLKYSLASLEKRHTQLEHEFLSFAEIDQVDVCSYRLFQSAHFRPYIDTIAKSLSAFQGWFTVIYDAIKNGPKQRAKSAPDVVTESAFLFGYTFSGSVGFVLTMPNERLLVHETLIDETVNGLFEMAKCDSSDSVARFARRYGSASVRQMSKWAKIHLLNGMGADIDWRRGKNVRTSVLLESAHIQNLFRAIGEISEEVKDPPIFVDGILTAFDTSTHSLKFETMDGVISGKASDSVATFTDPATLPTPYRAELVKTAKVNFAVEEEDVSWSLERLISNQSDLES